MRSTVIDLVAARLPKSSGYSPTADIQVIVPTRVGAVGANALNQSLQEALNPPSPEKAQFENNGRTFRVGDKVMQIKTTTTSSGRRRTARRDGCLQRGHRLY